MKAAAAESAALSLAKSTRVRPPASMLATEVAVSMARDMVVTELLTRVTLPALLASSMMSWSWLSAASATKEMSRVRVPPATRLARVRVSSAPVAPARDRAMVAPARLSRPAAVMLEWPCTCRVTVGLGAKAFAPGLRLASARRRMVFGARERLPLLAMAPVRVAVPEMLSWAAGLMVRLPGCRVASAAVPSRLRAPAAMVTVVKALASGWAPVIVQAPAPVLSRLAKPFQWVRSARENWPVWSAAAVRVRLASVRLDETESPEAMLAAGLRVRVWLAPPVICMAAPALLPPPLTESARVMAMLAALSAALALMPVPAALMAALAMMVISPVPAWWMSRPWRSPVLPVVVMAPLRVVARVVVLAPVSISRAVASATVKLVAAVSVTVTAPVVLRASMVWAAVIAPRQVKVPPVPEQPILRKT